MQNMMDKLAADFERKFATSANGRTPIPEDPIPEVVKRLRAKYGFLKVQESKWPKIPKDVAWALYHYSKPENWTGTDAGADSRLHTWYSNTSLNMFIEKHSTGVSDFCVSVMKGQFGEVIRFMNEIEEDEGSAVLKDFLQSSTEWSYGQSYVFFAVFGKQRVSGPGLDHDGVIRALVTRGCPVDHRCKWGYTAFHQSLMNAPLLDSAKLLLDLGADINSLEIYKNPVAMSAVMSMNKEVLRFLLQNGADMDINTFYFCHAGLPDAETVCCKDTGHGCLYRFLRAKEGKGYRARRRTRQMCRLLQDG